MGQGVYGGGLNATYVNIEKLIVDGAEGDDRYFVLSTNADVVTEIDGGLGSDSFFVGGSPADAPIPVISNDLKGHSGVILHSVESTDPLYDGITVDGISANVADNDESFIVVTESGGISVVTEDILGFDLAEVARREGVDRVKIVGNLPYCITAPILLWIIRQARVVSDAFLMMQLEVAERISAPPGGPHYGPLTVAVQFWSRPAILFMNISNVTATVPLNKCPPKSFWSAPATVICAWMNGLLSR